MNSKWQLSRVGLVNFWYYDEEEFSFQDGRMLLRGANGSGKSVTMQSFIPLLLDGNMRPERLDPFGSNARKMENYLLEEGDSIYYDSIVPHHVHAYEGQAAKILAVIYTPI